MAKGVPLNASFLALPHEMAQMESMCLLLHYHAYIYSLCLYKPFLLQIVGAEQSLREIVGTGVRNYLAKFRLATAFEAPSVRTCP